MFGTTITLFMVFFFTYPSHSLPQPSNLRIQQRSQRTEPFIQVVGNGNTKAMKNTLEIVKKNITTMLVNKLFVEMKKLATIDVMQSRILDQFEHDIEQGVQASEESKPSGNSQPLESFSDPGTHSSSTDILSKQISKGSPAAGAAGNQGPPGLWGKDEQQKNVGQQSNNKRVIQPRKTMTTESVVKDGRSRGLMGGRKRKSQVGQRLGLVQGGEWGPLADVMKALKKIQDCQEYGTCVF